MQLNSSRLRDLINPNQRGSIYLTAIKNNLYNKLYNKA